MGFFAIVLLLLLAAGVGAFVYVKQGGKIPVGTCWFVFPAL